MPDRELIKIIRQPDGQFYWRSSEGWIVHGYGEDWQKIIENIRSDREEEAEREKREAAEALQAASRYLDSSLPVGPAPDTTAPTKAVEILPMLPMPTPLDGLAEGEVYCFVGGAFISRQEYLAKLRTA
jgi:hypothetical protein